MTDYLGAEAVRAIAANATGRSSCTSLSMRRILRCRRPKADYDALSQIADHRLRVYAAMIRALDRNVGQVLAALKDNGLADNTLVIFTSDNGGAHYIGLPEINKPFRGWKATFFEGGIHVPFFTSWPAKLAKGIKFDQPIGHVDIFSTVAGAAGAAVPTTASSMASICCPSHGQVQERPHQTLYWRDGDYKVLLEGYWKLQVSERPKQAGCST